MSDTLNGKLSSLAGNSTIVNLIVAPLKDIIIDINEIARKNQIPEHITHIILVIIAIGIGSAAPFIAPKEMLASSSSIAQFSSSLGSLGTWLSGIVESFGLTGRLNTLVTWGISAWGSSYPVSAVVNWGSKIVHKCIWGDWDYRLTSADCIKIAGELEIPSTELREIFNKCVRLYRNPPKTLAAQEKDYKDILDDLLGGNPLNGLLNFRRQEVLLLKLRDELHKCDRILTSHIPASNTAEESDGQREIDEIISTLLTSPKVPTPAVELPSSAICLTSRPELAAVVVDSSDGKNKQVLPLPTSNPAPLPLQEVEHEDIAPPREIALGQLPPPSVESVEPSVIPDLQATKDILYLRRVTRQQSSVSGNTITKNTIAVQKQIRALRKAITIPPTYEGHHRIEREELIVEALQTRGEWLLSTRKKATAEDLSGILAQHFAALQGMTNPQLQEQIAQDKLRLQSTESKRATPAPV